MNTTNPHSEPIRVLLADDQHLVRAGLAALLNLEPGIEVVAELPSGVGAVEEIRQHNIDVAILDIEMPEIDGITATEQITAHTSARVLILTTFDRPGYLQRATAAGALGFMVKDTPAEELAAAVRKVAVGQRVIDPTLAAEALTLGTNPLTDREADVLRETLTGASVRDIARVLSLSPGTVRNHLSSAITKTGTENRSQAAHRALLNGWL